MKSKNHEICQDLMISYVEAMVKKLRRFCTICHIRCLQTEVSKKKNRSVEKDSIRFGVKVTIQLGFVFKTFYIHNREHRLIHMQFW